MPMPAVQPVDAQARLLDLAATLVEELHPGRRARVTLQSSIERDLGLDSLARVELLLRAQHDFGVALADRVAAEADTLGDVLEALREARPAPEAAAGAVPSAVEPPSEPPVEAALPAHVDTLTAMLAWRVQAHPERVHVRLLGEDEREDAITYGDLHDGAARVATSLLGRGLRPGESVAIMLPTGRDYLFAFFGILLAGGVPVPIYPPARLSQVEDHMRRHATILENAQAVFLVTVPQAKALGWLLGARIPTMRALLTPQDIADDLGAAAAGSTAPAVTAPRVPRRADDVAFLQYTSGSTGNPKGVVLTHANLLANIRAMGRAVDVGPHDVYVSWLPLYHDMGLIASWLASACFALPFVLMSPLAFLARPQRWLWALHRYRGTVSGAPNFAYELCVRRLADAELEGLDLSSWRIAYNGAEPVSPATMGAFIERFGRYGFRPGAMTPAYGLAECSVCVTVPPPGRGPRIERIAREPFAARGQAQPAAPDEPDPLLFVGCGRPLPDHQIRIVDPTGVELGERRQGRLEFRGPSATQGYFRNPEQTRKLLDGDWRDTGDLAFLADGELFLTGRVKDLIIRGGRNLHPYELEEAVGHIAGVRRGCVAVFASPDPHTGTERLVVLAETRASDPDERARLRRAIEECAIDILGMPPDDVALVPPQSVPKTSSGKIRRAASRELYEHAGRATRRAPVWLQLVRLALGAVPGELTRLRRRGLDLAYGAWFWSVVSVASLPAWLLIAASSRPQRAWSVARGAARLVLRLTGLAPTVEGLERLPRDGRCLVAANHASYLDGLVVAAALPQPLAFVAKAELRDQFVAGTLLRRLGTRFVERFDVRRGLADAEALAAAARAGSDSLMFFPEGTFTRASGLRPFQMGAFVVAARSGLPIVPVAIRGTREVLRDESWWPRRGTIAITVCAPVADEDADWSAAIRLRDATRAALLRHCGEPDLEAPGPAITSRSSPRGSPTGRARR